MSDVPDVIASALKQLPDGITAEVAPKLFGPLKQYAVKLALGSRNGCVVIAETQLVDAPLVEGAIAELAASLRE